MIFFKEKNTKYIFLIGFISLQLIGYSTAGKFYIQIQWNLQS